MAKKWGKITISMIALAIIGATAIGIGVDTSIKAIEIPGIWALIIGGVGFVFGGICYAVSE